jgi:hypothetical protein
MTKIEKAIADAIQTSSLSQNAKKDISERIAYAIKVHKPHFQGPIFIFRSTLGVPVAQAAEPQMKAKRNNKDKKLTGKYPKDWVR